MTTTSVTPSAARPRTAADLLVACLEAEGCELVFSVPGEETMGILDALSRSSSIRHVTTRHEQGAAFMADVYGRLTGRCAVAMSTLGPGATNLLTGIADAYLDRAPMVAITGQAGSDKLHKEAHQVVDIVRMFEPVTKWNTRVERVDAIPEIVRKAFRVATLEKPGPTHLELPENLAAMEPESGDATQPLPPTLAYFPEPTDQAIEHAARLISTSERPLILAGVTIPFELGLDGHSDADIVCHAMTDAVLGAAGAGDIGRLFPDTDPQWKGADSVQLLKGAVAQVQGAGYRVSNVDVTVIAQKPKLLPYLDRMRENLAAALGVDAGAVSVKGKTNEGVDSLGRGESMACHAVALLVSQDPRTPGL